MRRRSLMQPNFGQLGPTASSIPNDSFSTYNPYDPPQTSSNNASHVSLDLLTPLELASIQSLPGTYQGALPISSISPSVSGQNGYGEHGLSPAELERATRDLMQLNMPPGMNSNQAYLSHNAGGLNGMGVSPHFSMPRAWRPYEQGGGQHEMDPSLMDPSHHPSHHAHHHQVHHGHQPFYLDPSTSFGPVPSLQEEIGQREEEEEEEEENTPPPPSATRKRPAPSTIQHPNKRPRSHPSNPSSSSKRGTKADRGGNANRSRSPAQTAPASKPPLLTAEQKKANHILSEQKRRAKIRRGYDALCEVVPSLREAILAEENGASAAAAETRGRRKGNATNGKKEEAKNVLINGDNGRAGPKSESVVLSQTIDYIEDLLARKMDLIDRLSTAQQTLQKTLPLIPHHPGLEPQIVPKQEERAVWEREWDGGTGVEEGEDDEDGGDWDDD